jgi:Lrp/AsnC family leucine-responsive transcriptional regulator
VDRIDFQILALLQHDGRMSNADLAKRINLSPSACHRRVGQLEAAGVIDGYVAVVNRSALGKPTTVFAEVKLSGQNEEALDAFEKAARSCPDILECYLMAGDADYLLHIAVSDVADYERFHRQYLSRFPGVAHIQSSFSLRTVCKRTAVPA